MATVAAIFRDSAFAPPASLPGARVTFDSFAGTGSFGAPEQVSDPEEAFVTGAVAAIDPATGKAIVLWTSGTSGAAAVRYAVRPPIG